MLRISWQTLRARRASLTGAFVAIWLAVTLAYAAGLLMTGALSAPGPGRFAAADAVVRADPTIELGPATSASTPSPAPRLDAAARRPRGGGRRRRARRRRRLVPGRRVRRPRRRPRRHGRAAARPRLVRRRR